MKKWLKDLEGIMAASAYAEAGEFDTARDSLTEQRRILLGLSGSDSEKHAMKYAINACVRNKAGLEILYTTKPAKALIDQFQHEFKKSGIDYITLKRNGRLEDAIREHTNRSSNILFVVIRFPSEAAVTNSRAYRKFEGSWKRLKCPLVTVSGTMTA